MTPKPSWKKGEFYLVALVAGAMIYELQQFPLLVTQAGLPAQYAGIVGGVLSLMLPALIGWFAKLRHDAYAQAGIPEPTPTPAPVPGNLEQKGFACAKLMGLVLLAFGVACAALKTVSNDTVDCAKQDQAKLAASLLLITADLLQQNYVALLDTAAQDLGDVVLCDVAALSASEANPATVVAPLQGMARANAAAYVGLKKRSAQNVPALAALQGH